MALMDYGERHPRLSLLWAMLLMLGVFAAVVLFSVLMYRVLGV